MRVTRWGRVILGALVLGAGLGLVPAAPATAEVPVLLLDGTGFGHGVGLSQWGARYMASTGRSTEEILATFYPGTTLAEATGTIRVAVHAPATAVTTLAFPRGGEVRTASQVPGFPVRVGPGGRVRIAFDGAYRVTPLVSGQSAAGATEFRQDPCSLLGLCPTTTTTQPPTTTTTRPPAEPAGGGGTGPPPSKAPEPAAPGTTASSPSPVIAVPVAGAVTQVADRGRSYRGTLEAKAASGLRLVNTVGVEDYLRGMAEVPGSWPGAAVRAQTIAARTYALRAMQGGGEICDDARCQVYVGTGAESRGQNAAVAATARHVITYGGRLASAVYSADAGGVSANTFEGFGTPEGAYPYLSNVSYETDNPLPWHLVVGLDAVAGRLGYPGQVSGVRVSDKGPSGRALELVLEGSAGEHSVDGRTFARSLGLRSTRFEVALGSADGVPLPPPAAEEAVQALPEEVGPLARRSVGPTVEFRLDRAERGSTYSSGPTALPAALDPRRHAATLAAVLLTSLVAGALLPMALTRRS